MDDVVVMPLKNSGDIRDDLAVNAEKHQDLFPLENPCFVGYNEGSF
jgi:hypothetical protein